MYCVAPGAAAQLTRSVLKEDGVTSRLAGVARATEVGGAETNRGQERKDSGDNTSSILTKQCFDLFICGITFFLSQHHHFTGSNNFTAELNIGNC